jgi:hypothetical protein
MSGELSLGVSGVGQLFAGLAISDRAIELELNAFGNLSVHDLVGHRRCTAVLDRAARHELAVALVAAIDGLWRGGGAVALAAIHPGVGRGRAEVTVESDAVVLSVFDAWGDCSRSIRLDVASARQLVSAMERL